MIDEIVLQDITIWEQRIIESGYLSEEIIKTVNEKLRNIKDNVYDNEILFQELKTVIEIIISLVNRNEWVSKTKVYEKLVNSLRVEDTQLQKIILQKLEQVLDETIDEIVIRESLDKVLSLLNIWELNSCVNIILI
ncbi:hypothetical protein [Candidatus Rickettsia kedanie]|uniref:Uncharacterized protein n=1 Tax=Candidatus Rickettsia kedanie TaxID=3115352 RepID=A0ABP9TVX3_9RICK